MNHKYSTREIETACQRDINFMWLLEGAKVPDHSTIARFRSLHFAPCAQRIMAEVSKSLYQMGELSGETVFIDGTKIEACTNKPPDFTSRSQRISDPGLLLLSFYSICRISFFSIRLILSLMVSVLVSLK